MFTRKPIDYLRQAEKHMVEAIACRDDPGEAWRVRLELRYAAFRMQMAIKATAWNAGHWSRFFAAVGKEYGL